MNTKTTAPHPSQGELAEQRHLVDPLDHVLEHLADERPEPREVEIETRDRQILRASSSDSDDWDDETWAAWFRAAERAHGDGVKRRPLFDKVGAQGARIAELEGENAKLIRWHREDGSALAKLAARPSRAEVLREAADALEARVADVDVDTRATWAGMDAAYLRAMADEAATGGAL